jgi:hypothetical protein
MNAFPIKVEQAENNAARAPNSINAVPENPANAAGQNSPSPENSKPSDVVSGAETNENTPNNERLRQINTSLFD